MFSHLCTGLKPLAESCHELQVLYVNDCAKVPTMNCRMTALASSFLSLSLSLSSSLRRSETSASSKWPAAARSCTRSTSPTLVSRIGFERDCLVAVAVLVGTRRDEKSPTRVCGSSRSPIRTSAACTSAAVKSPMPASAVSSPVLSFSPSPHANHSIRDVLQSHALKKKISRRTATAFRS